MKEAPQAVASSTHLLTLDRDPPRDNVAALSRGSGPYGVGHVGGGRGPHPGLFILASRPPHPSQPPPHLSWLGETEESVRVSGLKVPCRPTPRKVREVMVLKFC